MSIDDPKFFSVCGHEGNGTFIGPFETRALCEADIAESCCTNEHVILTMTALQVARSLPANVDFALSCIWRGDAILISYPYGAGWHWGARVEELYKIRQLVSA